MAFSEPKHVIQESGLSEGALVGDFGAGSGHYSIAAGKVVGAQGRVYAIDIQKELLSRLKRDASAAGVRNIEILAGDIEVEGGSHLRSGMLNLVIMANVLFQAEHRSAVLAEAKRVLRPGGRVLFVDWKDSFSGIGPQKSDVIPEALSRELFERAGFIFERSLKNPGEHHYGFIMKLP